MKMKKSENKRENEGNIRLVSDDSKYDSITIKEKEIFSGEINQGCSQSVNDS